MKTRALVMAGMIAMAVMASTRIAQAQEGSSQVMAALSYPMTVQPGSELAAPRADGRIPGPYVAETMPVSVEQDYIVVEV